MFWLDSLGVLLAPLVSLVSCGLAAGGDLLSVLGALELTDVAAGSPDSRSASVLFLAVIQGVTEFLPVSSSGHLVLAQELLDLPREGRLVLNVALHFGTLLAVLFVYGREVKGILSDVLAGRWAWPLALVVGSVPAAVTGLALRDRFAEDWNTSEVAAWGLFGTALFLLMGEAARRLRIGSEESPRPPRFSAALLIGVAQALALFPGVSRAGVTIATGLLLGLGPRSAARFSFLLSIVAVGGASLLELPDAAREGFGELSTAWVLFAMGVAALVGWISLRGLLVSLKRGAFLFFALYCAGLGALALGLLG